MITLTEKAQKQLVFMQKVLDGEERSQYVQIGRTTTGCVAVYANVDRIGYCRLVEQNPNSGSVFSNAVHNGWTISWLMAPTGRQFIGPVTYRDKSGAICITTGADLKEMLK